MKTLISERFIEDIVNKGWTFSNLEEGVLIEKITDKGKMNVIVERLNGSYVAWYRLFKNGGYCLGKPK
mgnify:CR=1 FL=1